MLGVLLLLAAGQQTAVEAERAFATRAATTKQWAAFREYATVDAFMFVPQPVNAQEWLAKQPEPRQAVQWWPAESYVSCDRAQAVNTGPWAAPASRSVGFFTTVWVRQPDGVMKWVYDGGQPLAKPRPAGDRAKVRTASCRGRPAGVPAVRYASGEAGEGGSPDLTLQWRWHVAPDGARAFDAWLWDGRRMVPMVQDRVPAPPPQPKRG
jgi:hypothetical protein